MHLRHAVLAAVAACAVGLPSARADEILNIGDAAPKLAVSKFVKGDAVKSFAPGKTYVVEFWATWCGPCIASMPHVTELAHKYTDVKFVGVNVWENDVSLVAPFLEKMGDKMGYNVALDDVAKGDDPNEGQMAKTWLKAAGENGIPSAFIIHDQKIAWIGHPMKMDEPLAKIAANEWDPKEMASKRLADKANEKKMMAVQMKILKPYRDKDWKATLSAIEEVAATDPEVAKNFASLKYAVLIKSGDADAALAVGESLMEAAKDEPSMLNAIAWPVVDPSNKEKPDARLLKLALKAATRANEVSKGEDPAILDTYAEALFCSGDIPAAIAAEEKAVKVLEAKSEGDKSHPYFAQFKASLERFRKAAAKPEA